MIRKVEELSGRPVHMAEDADLKVMAVITTARGSAPAHFLRYRPGTQAVDYLVAYQLGFLERFKDMPLAEVQKITFEIAMLGSRGLDVNSPEEKYTLRSIPGTFSGLHLLCIEYVGFQIIDPKVDIGFDLSAEYAVARTMFGK